MSKGYRRLAIAALILMIGAGAAFAQSQGGQTPSTPSQQQSGKDHRPGDYRGYHRGQRHGRRHGMYAYLARQLQLTDAQKAQIKTMVQAQRASAKPLMQQLADQRKQLMTATAGGKFDQAKVTSIAQAQADVMAKLIVMREQVKSQIYNQVLTPDQRTKADQLQQKHMQRMEHWKNQPAGMAKPSGTTKPSDTPKQ